MSKNLSVSPYKWQFYIFVFNSKPTQKEKNQIVLHPSLPGLHILASFYVDMFEQRCQPLLALFTISDSITFFWLYLKGFKAKFNFLAQK